MAVPSIALAYRKKRINDCDEGARNRQVKRYLGQETTSKDFCTVMGKAPAKHMMEWHKELCTGKDSECLIGIGGPNTAILAPRGSAKSTVLGLYAAWMIGRHAAAKKMLRILYIAYMVDISRAKSATIKGILTSAKYEEIFPMVRLSKIKRSDEYWSIDYEFAGIDTAGEEAFTIACGGLRELSHQNVRSWCLSMTLLNPLRQSIILTLEGRWNRRGPTSLHLLCSKAHGQSVWGTRFHFDDFHATLFCPQK